MIFFTLRRGIQWITQSLSEPAVLVSVEPGTSDLAKVAWTIEELKSSQQEASSWCRLQSLDGEVVNDLEPHMIECRIGSRLEGHNPDCLVEA